MVRQLLLSTCLLATLWLPAGAVTPITPPTPEAAPAGTKEGAAALRSRLAAYTTAVPFERDILRIEPDPAGQRITLDPTKFLSELAGSPVRFAPISFVVSERQDGDWNVLTTDPIDIGAEPTIEGQTQTFEYRQALQHFKGIFSPSLAAFRDGRGEARDTTNVQADPFSRTTATIGGSTFSMTARPGSSGGVDIDVRQSYADYNQTSIVMLPPPDDAASDGAQAGASPDDATPDATPSSFGFEAHAAAVDTTATMKGGQTLAIRDLYALVLRHTGALEADPKAALAGPFGADLKAALGAVLPLWVSVDGTASARDLALTSLYGTLAVAEASQTLRFSGVEENASFDIDMAMSGIEATSPLLPPWAASLLPQDIEIGFAVSGADLKTPADIALAEVDFAQDPPLSLETQARIAQSFDATRITSRLKPSRIRSADLDLAFSGTFTFAEARPAAQFAVEAGGIDRAIATLRQAAQTEPELHQAVGLLQAAKGFGRPKGERLEWIVEAAADGSVTINGTTLKGPDPIAEPGTTPEEVAPSQPDEDTEL